MTRLTLNQQSVLQYIQEYVTERGASPLIREVQDGCRIGSYKAAVDRLNSLERKGFIRRIPNKHRGIRLPRNKKSFHPKSTYEDGRASF